MKLINGIIIFLVLGLTSLSSNAAFILNGNQSIEVFNLGETFEDFYDLGGNLPNSSNTGLEQVDTAVMLLAEFGGEYALIATFGGLPSIGDNIGGALTLMLTNDGFGSFTLIDDLSDPVSSSGNTTTIDFEYSNRRNDGFIFFLGSGVNTDLSVSFSNLVGLDDFTFLSDGGGAISTGSSFTLSNVVDVNAPLGPFALIGIFLILMRQKALKIK